MEVITIVIELTVMVTIAVVVVAAVVGDESGISSSMIFIGNK